MSNAFEEARHQGYTEADMAADQKEITDRMEYLGCPNCKYGGRNSRTCESIIIDESNIYRLGCPLYSQKEV